MYQLHKMMNFILCNFHMTSESFHLRTCDEHFSVDWHISKGIYIACKCSCSTFTAIVFWKKLLDWNTKFCSPETAQQQLIITS